MRRAVAAVLIPPWLVGLIAASLYTLTRWAWAAAADGWEKGVAHRLTPALGALLVALTVAAVLLLR